MCSVYGTHATGAGQMCRHLRRQQSVKVLHSACLPNQHQVGWECPLHLSKTLYHQHQRPAVATDPGGMEGPV